MKLFNQRYGIKEIEKIGNRYARLLVERLKPKLVLCGHMHIKYRSTIHTSSSKTSHICCLANVRSGKDSLAIFKVEPDKRITEL